MCSWLGGATKITSTAIPFSCREGHGAHSLVMESPEPAGSGVLRPPTAGQVSEGEGKRVLFYAPSILNLLPQNPMDCGSVQLVSQFRLMPTTQVSLHPVPALPLAAPIQKQVRRVSSRTGSQHLCLGTWASCTCTVCAPVTEQTWGERYTITESTPLSLRGSSPPPPTRFTLPAARGKTSISDRDW